MSRVGFIGAGRMGAPMVARLAGAALTQIAAAGSAATFIAAVGDFIGKDVAVVRKAVAELGIDIDRLDDIVNSGLPT